MNVNGDSRLAGHVFGIFPSRSSDYREALSCPIRRSSQSFGNELIGGRLLLGAVREPRNTQAYVYIKFATVHTSTATYGSAPTSGRGNFVCAGLMAACTSSIVRSDA